jgi:NAD(P)-dependent dehydrogenase (short-subunit alcohol dehydrogenase family)
MSDRVALVTGASRGIGAALAVNLAREGFAVACAARATRQNPQANPGILEDVVDRIRDQGGTAVAVPVDLAKRDQVAAMVETAVAALGRLDVLVNNAATGSLGGLDVALDAHDQIMAVDLDGPFIACRQAVPHLRAAGEGRILNVSSFAALRALPISITSMSYGMAKIALERMTVDLARQLAPDHIAVNCFRVDAGVASEGARAAMPDADFDDWEAPEVAAEGIAWMLRQPVSYTGQLESMSHLARREGIMPSVAARPGRLPPTEFG